MKNTLIVTCPECGVTGFATLPSAESDRWIPVDERLPDDGKFVLVSTVNDDGTPAVAEAQYAMEGTLANDDGDECPAGFYSGHCDRCEYVWLMDPQPTHWREKPDPPDVVEGGAA